MFFSNFCTIIIFPHSLKEVSLVNNGLEYFEIVLGNSLSRQEAGFNKSAGVKNVLSLRSAHCGCGTHAGLSVFGSLVGIESFISVVQSGTYSNQNDRREY